LQIVKILGVRAPNIFPVLLLLELNDAVFNFLEGVVAQSAFGEIREGFLRLDHRLTDFQDVLNLGRPVRVDDGQPWNDHLGGSLAAGLRRWAEGRESQRKQQE
jgi:hypothetical protein